MTIDQKISDLDPELSAAVAAELQRQEEHIELIASENYASAGVMTLQGSVLTNKYAEGYPSRRYYGGCENVDVAENLAIDRAKQLFSADFVNVQAHSGSQANMAVYMSLLEPGDTILGMSLAEGGHLTHGHPVNFSGRLYNFFGYGLDNKTGMIDYQRLEALAKEEKPKMIVGGFSAYSRIADWDKFRQIADSVGAYLMVDMAHIAGLVAAGCYPNPVPIADITTSTTHKTLRGPRGGIILMGKDFENTWGKVAPKSGRVKLVSELIDSMIMPGIQGGPLMHIIAAKAVAFGEAMKSEFKSYTQQIVNNAKTMADKLLTRDYKLVSGGTDTHVILIDLTNKGVSGKAAEKALEKAGITVNKNMVPFDQRSPFITSGIRVGTPAITTRGMAENEMNQIVDKIDQVISDIDNEITINRVKMEVKSLCESFPLYRELHD